MGNEVSVQSRGGQARAEALTAKKRSEIARNAAMERWRGDIPRATHQGVLHIGGVAVSCAVLEGGQRLITQSGFMMALGRARQAKGRQFYDADVNMPAFLTAKNLKPYISKDLEVTSSQVIFRPVGSGRVAYGYPAELLPKVCDVFLDAEDAGALSPQQHHIAAKAKMLIRGLAHVGIVALVDEATGYQEVRDRLALQAILDAYLSRELAAWAKRFPDEFYKEIFRLRNWTWDDLKNAKGQGPRVLGKYTNDFAYSRLAPGILDELQRRNPPDSRGRRRTKHHQWLTEDVGHPALAQHLHAVIGLMRASDTWEEFQKMLARAFPRRTEIKDLPLFNQPLEA